MPSSPLLAQVLKSHEAGVLSDWIREQTGAVGVRRELLNEGELREQCREVLGLLVKALQSGAEPDPVAPAWAAVYDLLSNVSRTRAMQGFRPSETATFILSLKRPVFSRLGAELGKNADALFDATWSTTEIIDRLALFTTEAYQKTREEIINRQQLEMLELSTPVVKLWDGILALPMIGTLDSGRTQVVMETLLEKIVEHGAQIAILDITGVPTVDTLVAQHLMKTVAAARLMGADCIISGIRPQIAQTIVHLALDLGDMTTKATLADAFRVALQRLGQSVSGDLLPARV